MCTNAKLTVSKLCYCELGVPYRNVEDWLSSAPFYGRLWNPNQRHQSGNWLLWTVFCLRATCLHSVRPVASAQFSTMRETVTIQVGQCGNQIGNQFWSQMLLEHEKTPDTDDALSAFFRFAPQKDGRSVDGLEKCSYTALVLRNA